jgi:cation diffusion facilitator family transporter
MHAQSTERWTHEHVFLGKDHARNERRTRVVIGLCAAMMAAEIIGGIIFGSMALVADGLHMSTHAAALLIAALAYNFARHRAHDPRFTFGTGKFGDLAGFTSAIVLAMIAMLIGWESVGRLLHPIPIAFDEAIPIAFLGLGVNLVSAWLLRDEHDDHPRDAEDHPDHHHRHDDLNLRAAYVHVLADAAVSILAVVGLVTARAWGWLWMDAVMGIIGALVIANWSWRLVRAAGAVLLDIQSNAAVASQIRRNLEIGFDRVADLHLWRVGPGHNAVVATVVSHQPQPPQTYKERLSAIPNLSHVTIEVEPCLDGA